MPPKKKKPTARAKPAARKPAARKTVAKRTTRAPAKRATPRAPAKRTTRAPAKRATPRAPRGSLKPDPVEQPLSGRPVAVGSVRPLWETDDVVAPQPQAPGPPLLPARESAPAVDRPAVEMVAAGSAVLLAASVFLPWYHNAPGTVNGWNSGTWGPIIFFLAVAVIAIIVLRRQGIPVAFPVEPTLVMEGIGWVCVIALILKRYFPPKAFGFKLPTDGWLFVSMGLAIGLALLAGLASSNAAFVLRPSWWKSTGGKIGTAVLAVALAGGLAFGFTNIAVSTAIPQVKANPPAIQSKGLPPCAKRINLPTPAGFTADLGSEIPSTRTCAVQFSSSLPLEIAFNRFLAVLRGAGWTVKAGRSSSIYRLAALSGRTCGNLTIAVTQPKVLVALVNTNPCPAVTPSK